MKVKLHRICHHCLLEADATYVCSPETCTHYSIDDWVGDSDMAELEPSTQKWIEDVVSETIGLTPRKAYQIMDMYFKRASPAIRERGMKWYNLANKLLKNKAKEFGTTPRVVAGVWAAASPRTAFGPQRSSGDLEKDMVGSLNYKRGDILLDRFFRKKVHDLDKFLAMKGMMDMHMKPAFAIMSGEDPIGVLPKDMKTENFFYNLIETGEDNRATIDRHMFRGWLPNPYTDDKEASAVAATLTKEFKKGRSRADQAAVKKIFYDYNLKRATYPFFSSILQKLAHHYGVQAKQIQAVVWEYVRSDVDSNKQVIGVINRVLKKKIEAKVRAAKKEQKKAEKEQKDREKQIAKDALKSKANLKKAA